MSTSILVYKENGSIGRLNMFDESDDIKIEKIHEMADHWRSYYGPTTKIVVVETADAKCRPNFRG